LKKKPSWGLWGKKGEGEKKGELGCPERKRTPRKREKHRKHNRTHKKTFKTFRDQELEKHKKGEQGNVDLNTVGRGDNS